MVSLSNHERPFDRLRANGSGVNGYLGLNSSAIFFDRIAKRILTAHATTLPDLRGITVLLPNFHVAQPLALALMRAAQRPALLLPQMVTLNE